VLSVISTAYSSELLLLRATISNLMKNPLRSSATITAPSAMGTLSTKGTVSFFRFTSMAVQGGGPGTLPVEDFRKLQAVIAHLPDDHSQLPPPGHRIVLQVAKRSKVLARVYDRANMPDSVLEILRLTGSGIRPLLMNFAPPTRNGH
jgi:hypothetical protein